MIGNSMTDSITHTCAFLYLLLPLLEFKAVTLWGFVSRGGRDPSSGRHGCRE